MKQRLELTNNNTSTYQFMVRSESALLHIKTKTASRVTFYLAVNGEEETLYYKSLYVDTMTNEPMIHMVPQSLMRIESEEEIEELYIEWSN